MFDFNIENMGLKTGEINKLLKVSRVLNSTLDLEAVISEVLFQVLEAVGAEAGTLWLLSEDGELLEPAVALGPKADVIRDLKLRRGEGISGKVAESGDPLLVEDVTKDERWARRFDQSTGFLTKTMMVVPLVTTERCIGSLQIINKVNGELFNEGDLTFARALINQCAMIIENRREYTHQNQFLETMLKNIISAIESRDEYSVGHSQRVGRYSLMLAEEMGMQERDIKLLKRASYLHDIGKIGIHESVLAAAGPLDPAAAEALKKHPTIGAKILSQMEPKVVIRQIWAGVMYHHENYDGSGYPTGLSGDDIPEVARILSIANSFDRLTTDRLFRKRTTEEGALAEIEKGAGVLYDPVLVDLFIKAAMKQRHIDTAKL